MMGFYLSIYLIEVMICIHNARRLLGASSGVSASSESALVPSLKTYKL